MPSDAVVQKIRDNAKIKHDIQLSDEAWLKKMLVPQQPNTA
jgi:hypothetical protein